jgi:hypothetical protein
LKPFNLPTEREAILCRLVLWVFVVALGLDLALAALVFGLVAPGPRRAWQICAAAAELAAVAMTLLYFRPTLVRLFLATARAFEGGRDRDREPMGDVEQSPNCDQLRRLVRRASPAHTRVAAASAFHVGGAGPFGCVTTSAPRWPYFRVDAG